MAAIMTPMVISVHSVVGLDFAGGLTPGWHSTQFPPYFFFGAVTSGTAIVIILTILVRWGYALQDVITGYHLNALAKVMLVGSVMLSYSYLWEAWGAIYSDDLSARIEFFERMFGSIAPLFWAEKALNSIIPQLLWFPLVRRSPILLLLISAGIIVGMWIERIVFTISSLTYNHIPSWWFAFHPTIWDWATLAGSIGLFVTLFFLLLRFMPIVAMSEVREMIDKASVK
jgi:molybdopterin-containing oxidoreductase family membrane subunit